MFKRILVPLDGSHYSEKVLPYVELFAQAFESSLTFLHVIDPDELLAMLRMAPMARGFTPQLARTVEELPARAEAAALKYLETCAQPLRNEGIEVDTRFVNGKPADVVVAFGMEEDQVPTLIAMTTHGRSGLGRMVLGSVADRVLNVTHTPLLLVHPDDSVGPVRFEQVVVALDGSKFAEAILPYVKETTKRMTLPVHLVQVLPSLSGFYMGTQSEVTPPMLEEIEASAEAYLRQLALQLRKDGVQAETHLLRGDPDTTILGYVEDHPRTLVAITTHGRSGPGRWVRGSVADKIVRQSHQPVLVFRPLQADIPAERD